MIWPASNGRARVNGFTILVSAAVALMTACGGGPAPEPELVEQEVAEVESPDVPFEQPSARQEPPSRPAAAAPPQIQHVPLTEFLCCGQTTGETRIWGISYPRGWQVILLPNNPSAFFGALFLDPAGRKVVAYIPSATTVPGAITDVADVDSFLNALGVERRQEFAGFQEVQRQTLPGLMNGRLWVGTWPGDQEPTWEAIIAAVSPTNLQQVMPNMPRGYLTMMGVRAPASEWALASDIYERMIASVKIKRMDGGMEPGDTGIGEPAVKSGMVRFCPRHCDWIWVGADRDNWACPQDGYPTEPFQVDCYPHQRQQ